MMTRWCVSTVPRWPSSSFWHQTLPESAWARSPAAPSSLTARTSGPSSGPEDGSRQCPMLSSMTHGHVHETPRGETPCRSMRHHEVRHHEVRHPAGPWDTTRWDTLQVHETPRGETPRGETPCRSMRHHEVRPPAGPWDTTRWDCKEYIL